MQEPTRLSQRRTAEACLSQMREVESVLTEIRPRFNETALFGAIEKAENVYEQLSTLVDAGLKEKTDQGLEFYKARFKPNIVAQSTAKDGAGFAMLTTFLHHAESAVVDLEKLIVEINQADSFVRNVTSAFTDTSLALKYAYLITTN